MKQYLSYSEYWLWKNDKERYIKQYIEGEPQPTNEKMRIGTMVHKVIEDKRYDWLKEARDMGLSVEQVTKLRKIIDKIEPKRPQESEVVMRAMTSQGVKLLGIFDGFNKKGRELDEFKTYDTEYRWTQRVVDTNEQLSFYAYIYRLTYHTYFREIRLHAMNVKKGTVRTYITARGPKDISEIAYKIHECVNQMKREGIWTKRLSAHERRLTKLL